MTREEIIKMAKQAGVEDSNEYNHLVCTEVELIAFAKLVAEHEREACAKVCEEYAIGLERNYSEIIADKIRARGEA